MGGLDPAKILVILVLALVVLGPERLPKAARQIGSFLHDFMAFRSRLEQEVRSALPDVEIPDLSRVVPRGGLTGYLTGMMRDVPSRGTNTEARVGRDTAAEDEIAGGDGLTARHRADTRLAPESLGLPLKAAAAEGAGPVELFLDLDDPSWN